MSARNTAAALASVALLAACSENPAEPSTSIAASDILSNAQSVTVVMSGLDSPRGLAWGPPGAVYVAEAGELTVNGPCAPVYRGANCYSGTGAVSRLWRGRQERAISGLPSAANLAVGDIVGPTDVAFGGGMHVTIGWGGPPAARAQLGSLARGFGTVVRVNGKTWKVEADVAAVEAEQNAGGGLPDSNPYAALVEGGRGFVVDAGGNTLVEFDRHGGASVVAVFPPLPVSPGPFNPPFAASDAVPTEVERGPDGALYVSQLTGVPFLPGVASIFRVEPGAAPTVYATGFTQVTDFDWGPDGSLWVLQYAAAPFFGGPGSLIRVAPNGTRTTVVANLANPTGVLVGPDGAVYVSNRGNLPNVGEVLRIIP